MMSTEPTEFSLVVGGPLYRFYQRYRLAKPDLELMFRRIVVMLVITWLPLALLSVMEGRAFGGAGVSFAKHLTVHARLLLSLPLLIAAELIVHRRMTISVREFTERGLIASEDRPRFDHAIASAVRVRNSTAVEVLLMIVALTLGTWFWKLRSLQVPTWYNAETGYTVAGYWYVFVSLPVYRFILVRWYFRLIVWWRFLWQVSRIPLRLNALHPDRAGGLEFLNNTAFALMPVLIAQTVLVSGKIGDRIWHEGASLPQFQLEIIFIVFLLMLFVYFPQIFFIHQLYIARWAGKREYGVLAVHYVDNFREKWIRRKPDTKDDPLLGSADIQSLADLASSFDVINEMRLVPFTLRTVLKLGLLIILPLLPLLLTMFPLDQMIDRLFKLLL